MAGRVEAWVETYKKAMLTPVILRLVLLHQPVTIAALRAHLSASTGWQVTERGLYRTVRRLQGSGFLDSEDTDAPRTGAKRKELVLSPLGVRFLAGIEANLIDVPEDGTG